MIHYLYTYLAMTVAFLAVDLLWLGFVARPIYQKYLGHLMRENTSWVAAIVFYLLFLVGILIFAVLPAYEKASWFQLLIHGALFGFFTYMTFELTAFAVLKDWRLPIVFIDIVWGIILTTVVSAVGFWLLNLIT